MSDVVSEENKKLKRSVLQVPWEFDLNTTDNLTRGYLASMHGTAIKKKKMRNSYKKIEAKNPWYIREERRITNTLNSDEFYNPVELKFAAIEYKGQATESDRLGSLVERIDGLKTFIDSTGLSDDSVVVIRYPISLNYIHSFIIWRISNSAMEIVNVNTMSGNTSAESLLGSFHDPVKYIGTPVSSPSTIKPVAGTDRDNEYFTKEVVNISAVFDLILRDSFTGVTEQNYDTFTLDNNGTHIKLTSLTVDGYYKNVNITLKNLYTLLDYKKESYTEDKDDIDNSKEGTDAAYDYGYAVLGPGLGDINTADVASSILAFETYGTVSYDEVTGTHSHSIDNKSTRWVKQDLGDLKQYSEEAQKLLDIFDRNNKKVSDYAIIGTYVITHHCGRDCPDWYEYVPYVAWKIPKIMDDFVAWEVFEVISRTIFIGYEAKSTSFGDMIKGVLKSAFIAFVVSGGNPYAALTTALLTFVMYTVNPPDWLRYTITIVMLAFDNPTGVQIAVTSYSILSQIDHQNKMKNYKEEIDKLNEQISQRNEDFAEAEAGKFGIELSSVSMDDHINRVYNTNMYPPYVFPEVTDTYTKLLYS